MATVNNKEIRQAIADKGVRHWQVAEKIGVSTTHFSQMLQRELPAKRKEQILQAIGEMEAGE